MEVLFGTTYDIAPWMNLVKNVSSNFPGLETEELINEHRDTVLKFMSRHEALWVKNGEKAAGVLLFSKNTI